MREEASRKKHKKQCFLVAELLSEKDYRAQSSMMNASNQVCMLTRPHLFSCACILHTSCYNHSGNASTLQDANCITTTCNCQTNTFLLNTRKNCQTTFSTRILNSAVSQMLSLLRRAGADQYEELLVPEHGNNPTSPTHSNTMLNINISKQT